MARRLVASFFDKQLFYNKQLSCKMRISQPVFAGASLLFSSATTTSSFQTQKTSKYRSRLLQSQCPRYPATRRPGATRLFSSESNEAAATFSGEEFATEYHAPVMWKECIGSLLECDRSRLRQKSEGDKEPLVFIDGTLGGGGHSAALLDGLEAGDIVFGCDVDPDALETASGRLEMYMKHDGSQYPLFIPVQSNFGDLATVLPKVLHPVTGESILEVGVDGMLLDLGVSSYQIDTPERGFAFMKDGPLDMRMGGHTNSGLTAADICNEFDQAELQRIFSRYGDEPKSKTVAKAVVANRPVSTTAELVAAIATVTPKFHKSKRRGLTATCARVFQSLRIVVNAEDRVLDKVLSEACPALIRPGGRLVVLAYHSAEDRPTKRIMRDGTLEKKKTREERDMYGNYAGPPKPFKPVGKRQKAPAEEVEVNPRARSAVLRVAERQHM
jgi:16S rRNA (cytosine1402-N4)-methyltransferase